MKNRFFKQGLPVLLALMLQIGVLAGCGKSPEGQMPSGDSETQTPSESVSVTEEQSTASNLPSWNDVNSPEAQRYKPAEKNYNRDYTMLTAVNDFYYSNYVYDYGTRGEPTEICDVAIWQRQVFLEDQFGITLKRVAKDKDEASRAFIQAMAGGDKICDVICLDGATSLTNAAEGYLLDANQVTALNLDAPYWDQRIREEYRVSDYLFALEGEFNFIDDLRTYVVIYNDRMYSDHDFYTKYGSPYELSKNGKWTYAKMMEMINDCGSLNTELKEDGTWAMVSETSAPYYFLLGAGVQMLTNDQGTLNVGFKDNWQSVLSKIEIYMELSKNQNVFFPDRPNAVSAGSDVWTCASNIFMYNRALFRSTALSAVLRLLEMEDDYGIMPIPNYEETVNGEEGVYHCWVDAKTHYPLAFPVTSATEIQVIGEMTEVMAYYSLYGADSLNRAFYDLLAYARLCRRPEDKEMLRLVFANKTYDIDFATQITGASGIINSTVYYESYDTMASQLDGIKTAAEARMQKWVSELLINVSKKHPDLNN